jgi:F-type H+-transporting ATPase subunit alpha
MRAVSGTLKGDMSRYNEVKAFAQFGTEGLDQATRNLLTLGERLTELFKQGQYEPLSLGEEVVVLFSSRKLDGVPVPEVRRWEKELLAFVRDGHPDLLKKITDSKLLDPESEKQLDGILDAFKKQFAAA